MEPRGILRNKEEGTNVLQAEELDRQEVIRNTRLNAQLKSETAKGDKIRAEIALFKSGDDNHLHPEHLQWDEINLYKTEQEKAATMKIDEPKTPYEGGFDPNGEYYRDDEEQEIPDFSLGEGQFEHEDVSQSMNGGQLLNDEKPLEEGEEEEEKEEEATPLLAEDKHRKFDEMRKAHYHLAANPLKHKIEVPDEDE